MTSPITDELLKELDGAADEVTVYKYHVGLGFCVPGYVQVEADDMKSIVSELRAARAAREALRPLEARANRWSLNEDSAWGKVKLGELRPLIRALSGNRSGKC